MTMKYRKKECFELKLEYVIDESDPELGTAEFHLFIVRLDKINWTIHVAGFGDFDLISDDSEFIEKNVLNFINEQPQYSNPKNRIKAWFFGEGLS